jgi:chromate reductase
LVNDLTIGVGHERGEPVNIVMLVGSLRADSWTARLAGSVAGLLPEAVDARVYDAIGELPHYSQDLDTDTPPAAVVAFREAIAAADGLVVATPEYNGSIPGVLKNAIDWASRPRGAAALSGKPAAVLSVSPSPRGAQWAREDLEKVLRVAGAHVLDRSVGIASVHEAVVEGRFVDGDLEQALSELMRTLVAAEVRDAA